MAQAVPIDIRGFKGLNLREPAGMIQDDELSSCLNFDIGRAGELTKRTGFAILHDATTLPNAPVEILGHYKTLNYSQIIAKCGGSLWRSSDGASWTEIPLTVPVAEYYTYNPGVSLALLWNVDTGGSAADSMTVTVEDYATNASWGVQYANKFYILRHDELMLEWDGASLSILPDTPRATYGMVYKDRLFTCNWRIENEESRLKYSEPGDFADWPVENFIDVNQGDGDHLTCCAIIHDLLIVFKTQTTWALYTTGAPVQWVLRNSNPEIGCISKSTPREIEGFLYFVGVRGVYKTDGNIYEDISSSIEPVFNDRVIADSTVDVDSAAWWEDRYILFFHPTASTYRYFIYHLRTGGWTEWEFAEEITPATFLEITTAVPQRGLYAGTSSASGRVYRHGDAAFTDAGTPFECSFETKDFDFTLPSTMKRGMWMLVDIDSAAASSWTQETDGDNTVIGATIATDRRRAHKLPGPGYFRTWKLTGSVTSNLDFTFYGITLYMAQKTGLIKART